MPRRNLVMWSFAALLIAGAGLFPLQAVFGISWRTGFLGVVAVDDRDHRDPHRRLAVANRRLPQPRRPEHGGLQLPQDRRRYMPRLDEGSILDMPVTVPRASVAETADDIKARDAMLRRFPEVEMVVGKSGRADTPTDPSPLEMLETIITLRPKEFWPKRMLRYADAERQTRVVMEALAGRGLLSRPQHRSDRDALVNTATMAALGQMDAALRELSVAAIASSTASLGRELTGEFVAELIGRWRAPAACCREVPPKEIDLLARDLAGEFAPILAAGPAQGDINRLVQRIAEKLAAAGAVRLDPELLSPGRPAPPRMDARGERAGDGAADAVHRHARIHQGRRDAHWREQVRSSITNSSTKPSGLQLELPRRAPQGGEGRKGGWAGSWRTTRILSEGGAADCIAAAARRAR